MRECVEVVFVGEGKDGEVLLYRQDLQDWDNFFGVVQQLIAMDLGLTE